MPRVFLGVGHGGSDPGAVANGLVEANMNLVMALECKRQLERHNIITGISRNKNENDDLSEEIRECKAFNPDIAIDIHNNSGGGDGFEYIYSINQSYTNGRDVLLGRYIEEEVKVIWQNSRGGKTRKDTSTGRDYFGWIRELPCPSIIVEGCFLDSNDRLIADTVEEQKEFGKAYAKGILKYFGIKYKNEVEKVEYDMKNLVCYGNSIDKRAAEYLAEHLKCPCIDAALPFDYKGVSENIIAVGGAPANYGNFSGYTTKRIIGGDRYETLKAVLKFIGKL